MCGLLSMVRCTIKIPAVCREELGTCTRQRVPSGIRAVIVSEIGAVKPFVAPDTGSLIQVGERELRSVWDW